MLASLQQTVLMVIMLITSLELSAGSKWKYSIMNDFRISKLGNPLWKAGSNKDSELLLNFREIGNPQWPITLRIQVLK
jgi:hypothetical protein